MSHYGMFCPVCNNINYILKYIDIDHRRYTILNAAHLMENIGDFLTNHYTYTSDYDIIDSFLNRQLFRHVIFYL